jgi:porin
MDPGRTLLAAAAVLFGVAEPTVVAQQDPGPGTTGSKRLFDAYWDAHDDLCRAGPDLELSNTNFYQGLASGTGNPSFEFGGTVSGRATFDLSRFGFWSGLSLTFKGEHNYGMGVNGRGGKINMIDQARSVPLRGGGGIETFQNIGLAAPVTGLVPPYIFGAIGTLRTEPAIFTVMVFEPESAVRRNPNDLFENGVNVLGSVTIPVSPLGPTGFESARVVARWWRAPQTTSTSG